MEAAGGPWPVILSVLGVVGSIGGLGGIVAVINANAVRRKTDAEANKTYADTADKITDAALKIVEPLKAEVDRQSRVTSELHSRVGQLESDQRTQHMLLVEHSVWDHLALARMKDAGVDLPPIPPLFPSQGATASVEVKVTTES